MATIHNKSFELIEKRNEPHVSNVCECLHLSSGDAATMQMGKIHNFGNRNESGRRYYGIFDLILCVHNRLHYYFHFPALVMTWHVCVCVAPDKQQFGEWKCGRRCRLFRRIAVAHSNECNRFCASVKMSHEMMMDALDELIPSADDSFLRQQFDPI